MSSVLEKNLLDVEDLSLVSTSQSYIPDFFWYNTDEQSTGKFESKITILEKRRHEIYKKGCMKKFFSEIASVFSVPLQTPTSLPVQTNS